jgi:NAD dependent epimerase/dehydratase family enzyme
MADMVLAGQKALPKAAEKLGYNFKHATITEALESLGL